MYRTKTTGMYNFLIALSLVRVFSDLLVAFLYFDICYLLVAHIKIWKSQLNIREDLDYSFPTSGNFLLPADHLNENSLNLDQVGQTALSPAIFFWGGGGGGGGVEH